MADGDSSGGFGARFLIMLYALGIVMIGAHDLRKQHGNITAYLGKESSAFARSLFSGNPLAKTIANEPSAGVGSSNADEQPGSEKKPVDKLTDGDRKQLSKLINSL